MKKQILIALMLLAGLASSGLDAQTTGSTPPEENPTGNAGALKPQVQTGGSYDAHSGNATRIVNDLHVPGALGVYGLDFTRYWNSTHNDAEGFDMEWARDFGDSGWSHSWRWAATYEYGDPEPVLYSCGESGLGVCESDDNRYTTAINVMFPDGHTTRYKIVRVGHGQYMIPGSNPWWGPPYTPAEIQSSWPDGGKGVHDHLCNMAPDGSQFWICRADGGSVHFFLENGGFLAKEVYDPHGLKTTLAYTNGYLTHVEQPGGRFLDITWQQVLGAFVITKVASGPGLNDAGVNPSVFYTYVEVPGTTSSGPNTIGVSLQQVVYDNEPNPDAAGQKVMAFYHYGNCWGDEPAADPPVCTDAGTFSYEPLLKRADDPHFAGPMTTIRYNYRGAYCPALESITNEPWTHPNYFQAQAYAIATEMSDTGVAVSSFEIGCDTGKRKEYNGLGGWRTFFFGTTAQTSNSPFGCSGFQLGKLTDFTLSGVAPYERQNYSAGHPRQIWDGRNIMTEAINGQDDSGEPAEIHHVDTSVDYYDRVNPGNSAALDPVQGMNNPYNHWLFSETHQLDGATTYTTLSTRDARRRVTRIDYPGGTFEQFAYNQFNQVTSHTLTSGAVITYTYDTNDGRLLSESNSIDGADARKDYTYDSLGRVLTVCDGRARANGKDFSTRMTYNGRHQVVMVEYAGMFGSTPADNPHASYGYDADGNCTSITDEMGHRSAYTYDLYRRCTSYTEPLNAPDPSGNNAASRRWDWVYDRNIVDDNFNPTYRDLSAHTGKDWRIEVEPAYNDSGERRVTHRFHDVNGRIVLEQRGWIERPGPPPVGDWYWSGLGRTIYYTYDENGQKKTYTDPMGRVTTYDYDVRNRLWKTNETVNTIPRTTETLYDWAGNKTMVKFPAENGLQRTQQWQNYDAFGQAWRFIDERNNPTDLIYCWGPMKKLSTVTTHRDKDDGGTENQETNFSYDPMGKPNDVEFPDHTHETTTYHCKDGVGYFCEQPHTWTNRKGHIKYFHYDARGREDSSSWADIDGICNPATDQGPAPCIARQWDPANRLVGIANIFSSIDFAYDDASQVVSEGNTIAGSSSRRMQTSYRRYGDGSVAYLQYPDGLWVARKYSVRGELYEVWDSHVGWQRAVGYDYLADGKVNYQDYGNDTRTSFEYDGRGMTSLISIYRLSEYQNYSWRYYWRDERDRITAFQKSSNNAFNPMENGRGDRFRYDEEGQLIEAWYNAANPAVSGDGYTRYDGLANYDALGNRTGWKYVSSKGWIHFLRRDNKLNQYLSWENEYPDPPLHWGSGIFYDDNFNADWHFPGNGVTMAEGNLVASYNALNQPVAIIPTGSSNIFWFGYDPLGRCVKRAVGPSLNNGAATYFYYDGWNLIQEGAAGNPSRYYVHGARMDEIVKQIIQYNPAPRFFHYDARGHCTLQTDAGGHIVEQYEYDAFGYPYFFDASGNNIGYSPWGNRFLFTGREWLSDLKLYDYRNRLYQPELGRFMQPDPKEFAAGDYNLYRYCHNDPVNKSDPFGLIPPGDGLLDLPKKDMQEMFNAGQEAARKTQTEKSPDGPGGKLRHQEHRTANYQNDRTGERKNASETGYHKDELPMTDRPKNPFNEPATQKWDVHSHISGSGKPINADPGAAISLHVPIGIQSATGGPMYILVPTEIKGAGPSGLFYTPDGIHLYDAATHNPAPH